MKKLLILLFFLPALSYAAGPQVSQNCYITWSDYNDYAPGVYFTHYKIHISQLSGQYPVSVDVPRGTTRLDCKAIEYQQGTPGLLPGPYHANGIACRGQECTTLNPANEIAFEIIEILPMPPNWNGGMIINDIITIQ